MKRRRSITIAGLLCVAIIAPHEARAQRPGGMMGMRHDSATMALMMGSHDLVMNHDRVTRTVTNLSNGVRATTESDDPRIAALIKEHVATVVRRVEAGDDPGLPMETPAVHTLFANKDKIRTTTDVTAMGVVIVQTSDDPVVVAALQRHASELSDVVREGMPAIHRATMQSGGRGRGGMMHGGMMHGGMPGMPPDTAFAAMQQRGKTAMGVDQYTSTHHFDALPDGGRIELQRDVDDSTGIAQIRAHLQGIAKTFAEGDFTTPAFVHMRDVPGTTVMAAKRGAITYTYRELPRGGEVRIVTTDREALAAIHEFLAFQRQEHHAP
jgi:hypothetical protein